MLIIAILIVLAFIAVGVAKHLTAPSVEAHLAARAAYRENLANDSRI
jgi:multisubunit Na+/H+ antiporter MnhG subunit